MGTAAMKNYILFMHLYKWVLTLIMAEGNSTRQRNLAWPSQEIWHGLHNEKSTKKSDFFTPNAPMTEKSWEYLF